MTCAVPEPSRGVSISRTVARSPSNVKCAKPQVSPRAYSVRSSGCALSCWRMNALFVGRIFEALPDTTCGSGVTSEPRQRFSAIVGVNFERVLVPGEVQIGVAAQRRQDQPPQRLRLLKLAAGGRPQRMVSDDDLPARLRAGERGFEPLRPCCARLRSAAPPTARSYSSSSVCTSLASSASTAS